MELCLLCDVILVLLAPQDVQKLLPGTRLALHAWQVEGADTAVEAVASREEDEIGELTASVLTLAPQFIQNRLPGIRALEHFSHD